MSDIDKLAKEKDKFKVYCKCGHSINIRPYVDRVICNYCKNWVYKDKKTEFKYKFKENVTKC